MSNRDRHNQKRRAKAKQRRAAQHRDRHLGGRPDEHGPDDEPELILQVRDALAADHPLPLLDIASALIVAADPPPRPMEPPGPAGPDLDALLRSFLDIPLAETSALLLAFDGLRPQPELARTRIRRAIGQRPHRMPGWLTDLAATRCTRTALITHVLGDGDNLMLDLVLPDGSPMTVLAFIDHNMGSALKDAFCIPDSLDNALALFADASEDQVDVVDIAPADARAIYAAALDVADRTLGMPETETWPLCRALVEWAFGLLPEGGHAPEWTEVPEAELDRLAASFLASPAAEQVRDHPDSGDIVDTLLSYAANYSGDPLRWSPITVEILLVDWVPRKIMADHDYLTQIPAVVAAMIPWAHAEQGIPGHLTDQTVAAVGEHTAEFLEAIGQPRRMGPLALLERMGVLDPDEGWTDPDGDDEWSYEAFRRREREDAVGGPQALAALTDEPLPDEPLDVEGLPARDRDRAREVTALTDEWCDRVWDVEHRTACRRLIAETQRSNPATLRRGKAASAAAAICWLVGNANDAFNQFDVYVRDLSEHFGLTASPSDRARTILDTLDIPLAAYGVHHLHSPDFLVSRTRADLIRQSRHT